MKQKYSKTYTETFSIKLLMIKRFAAIILYLSRKISDNGRTANQKTNIIFMYLPSGTDTLREILKIIPSKSAIAWASYMLTKRR